MTDRELLERAAKAAGFGYGEWVKNGIVFVSRDALWNPLANDGDALRLAVKLQLMVDTYEPNPDQGGVWSIAWRTKASERMERHDADPYAATRRAIVRAAAATLD